MTHVPPTMIGFDDGVKIIKVACGRAHTLALSESGHVYSWGFGKSGCLGLGPNISVIEKPCKIDFEFEENEKEE